MIPGSSLILLPDPLRDDLPNSGTRVVECDCEGDRIERGRIARHPIRQAGDIEVSNDSLC